MSKFMQMAVDTALNTSRMKLGGPFGAAITKVVNGEEQLIAVSSNSVLMDHDPTAHAEVSIIRIAGYNLKTHDLTGCKLYTTCYPCPMCLFACMWANIKEVVYGCTPEDAEKAGFRDNKMYQTFVNLDVSSALNIKQEDRDMCLKLFEEYNKMEGQIY